VNIRLAAVSEAQLHPTFVSAFSNYAVDMSYMTAQRLSARAAKNGVDFDVSVGAFDGDRMVGFTLVGLGAWRGLSAAFDAATGIVPGYRGVGLAGRMLDHALVALRRRGVAVFVLEVLADNAPALGAYRKAGFETTRRLRCYQLERRRLAPRRVETAGIEVVPGDRSLVGRLADAYDWVPSWENGFEAIARIPDELIVLGARREGRLAGIIVFSPLFGWVMSLIVRREDRRRGVASALLRGLIDRLDAGTDTIKLLNVDVSDAAMIAFAERLGFERTVDQYEMALRISAS